MNTNEIVRAWISENVSNLHRAAHHNPTPTRLPRGVFKRTLERSAQDLVIRLKKELNVVAIKELNIPKKAELSS